MVFNKIGGITILIFLTWLTLASSQDPKWKFNYIKEIKCNEAKRSVYDLERLRKSETSIREILKKAKYSVLVSRLNMYQLSIMTRGKIVLSDKAISKFCLELDVDLRDIATFGKTVERMCDETDLQNMKCEMEIRSRTARFHVPFDGKKVFRWIKKNPIRRMD